MLFRSNLVSTQISYHQPVLAATVGTLETATGGTITYNQPNGGANGVGATLTTTGTFTTIDDANVQTVGTRILVKNQANAVLNGVYTYTNSTTITRSTDADTYGPNSTTDLSINDYFFVQSGNVNLGDSYIVSAPTGTITFGTSQIDFSQFSHSQVYNANTAAGLSLIGQTFNAKVDGITTAFDGGGNIVVKSSAQLTTPNIGAATGTTLSLTGTATVGNVDTGGTVSATGTITGGNLATGGTVSSTGTITGGNVNTGGNVSATGNVTGGNILTGGLISATGNITSGNSSTGIATIATATITTFANVTATTASTSNITGALRVAGGVGVTGNIYADGMYVGGDSVLTTTSTVDGGSF